MNWTEVEQDFFKEFPDLVTGELKVRDASAQWFFFPQGFKDVGSALVFGFLKGSESSFPLLLEELEKKAHEYGVKKVVGPLNLSTYLDYRVKMDHFEDSSYTGEPLNSATLSEMFKVSGYQIEKNYYSHEFALRRPKLWALFYLLGARTGWRLRKYSYRLVSLNPGNFSVYAEDIFRMLHQTFKDNFLYLPVPRSVFAHLAESYAAHLDSLGSWALLDSQGKCIGFTLCLLDPLRPERLLFKTLGVHPEHRHRGDTALFLMSQVYRQILFKKACCLACLMIENKKMDRFFSSVSQRRYSYALFSKSL